ncbi:DUF502 domain-containing protein [Teredinibacter purpureus]|uniref:DUF502 domain-containing protein n=1 Tax=Teredinibacter purpureus TaxID=2731756 RepID=UPI0005F78DCF|nr:DUF502 domain-containing protein [Teredinibacter purpureus]
MPNNPLISRPSVIGNLTKTFIAGLLAALPLAVTAAVIVWLAELVHRYLGPDSYIGVMLGRIGLNFVPTEISAYAIGVGCVLLVVYLLGVAVEAGLKNHWRVFTSSLLNRVPLVRSVYQTVSRLITLFDKPEKEEYKGMSAVMCYFGGDRAGTAVLALLTNPKPVEIKQQQYYTIVIPTAPVPFGGAILYMPIDWVDNVDFGFDGLVNIYMSMGVTSSDYFTKTDIPQKKP